ncbi:MAG TPA: hypothetical protein VGS09_10570, partial [Actinomycetota bacterium]|nr:hypothetical protein [Actinomycetota bacterium]
PKEIKTTIKALTAEAQADVDRFIRNNDGRVIGIRVEGHTIGNVGGRLDHAGGVVGSTGARRLHMGGFAGLRSNEVPSILERGELVWSKSQVASLRSILGMGAETSRSPTQPSSRGRDVKVAVRLDRRRFNDELDHDSTYDGRWA